MTVIFLRSSVEKETALTGATEQKSKVVTWWPRDRLLRRASRVHTGAAHQSAGACRQVAADGRWVSCQFALFQALQENTMMGSIWGLSSFDFEIRK